MPDIDVKDAGGNTVPIRKPAALGRADAGAAVPVVLSNEDLVVLSSIDTRLAALGGFSDGVEGLLTLLNGYVDTLETLQTAMSGKLPATLGQKPMTTALAVSIASDQSTFPVSPSASAATGGIASTSLILSAAANTNGTSAKAAAGRLYAVQGYNAANTVRYLKFYNKASAPTVGTDTPVKVLVLPPLAAFAFDWPHGYSFATGIAYALTTGFANADTGALAANDVAGLNVDYI